MVVRKRTKKSRSSPKGCCLPEMADNQAQQQTCFGCNGCVESREHDCLKALTKRLNRQRFDLNRLTRLVEKQKSVNSLHNLVISLVKRVQDLEEYKISESSRTELLYRQIDQLKRQNRVLIVALEDLGKTNNINSSNDSNNNNNSNLDPSANNETNISNNNNNNSSSSAGADVVRTSSVGSNNNRNNRNNNSHNNGNSSNNNNNITNTNTNTNNGGDVRDNKRGKSDILVEN